MTRFRVSVVLWILFSCSSLGCSGGDAHVTGTLTQNGAPLEVGEKGVVQVQFIQLQGGHPKGFRTAKSVDEQGHFEATVPPGTYRLAVVQLDPYPDTDKLKGAFNEQKSPIEKDLTSSQTIEIELGDYPQ